VINGTTTTGGTSRSRTRGAGAGLVALPATFAIVPPPSGDDGAAAPEPPPWTGVDSPPRGAPS
jgi:hypothetical protein